MEFLVQIGYLGDKIINNRYNGLGDKIIDIIYYEQ
jgi:hypothetical protein